MYLFCIFYSWEAKILVTNRLNGFHSRGLPLTSHVHPIFFRSHWRLVDFSVPLGVYIDHFGNHRFSECLFTLTLNSPKLYLSGNINSGSVFHSSNLHKRKDEGALPVLSPNLLLKYFPQHNGLLYKNVIVTIEIVYRVAFVWE